jgi:SAM-dependent methyltransferase
VRKIFDRLDALSVRVRPGTALDFGCGVGRLTRALSERFTLVYGVDAAASMVRHATEMNADRPNCRFLQNRTEDLSVLPVGELDFVLCELVLQHLRPPVAMAYVAEFLGRLRPGGTVVFYLPGRRVRRGIAPWVVSLFHRIRHGTGSTLDYGVPTAELLDRIVALGGELLEMQPGDWLDRGSTSPDPPATLRERLWVRSVTALTDRWEGAFYLVRKRPVGRG